MPDISMCKNKECPSNLQCYRYMAMPNPHRQAYSTFDIEGDGCEDYMQVYPEHIHMMMKFKDESK